MTSKPKDLDKILADSYFIVNADGSRFNTKAKQEIIAYFKSLLPEKLAHTSHSTIEYIGIENGYNRCIDEITKRIEGGE